MRIRGFGTVARLPLAQWMQSLSTVLAMVTCTACTTLLGNDFRFENRDASPTDRSADAANRGPMAEEAGASAAQGVGGAAGQAATDGAAGQAATDGAAGENQAGDAGPEAGSEDSPILVSPTTGLVTTENGGQATFTVALRKAPTASVAIGVSSSNPAEGTVSPTRLTFTPDNWNAPQIVTITGVDDALLDGNQAYRVELGLATSEDAQYAGVRGPGVAVTNIDDETAGITVIPTRGVTTTESGGSDSFTVVLNSKPSANVVLSVASSNTAEGTVVPAQLTFTPDNWRAPQLVTVTGVDDAVKDGPAKYFVVLSPAVSNDPSYSGRDPEDVEVTNVDNDTAGFSLVPPAGLSTSEKGAKATFTLALNVAPTKSVTIGLSSSNPKEGTVTPSKLVFTPQNWKAPQTVIVAGQDDSVADGNQVYWIVTAPAESEDADYSHLDPPNVSVTNIDDDSPGFTVTFATGLETTEAAGGVATFLVSLNSKPTANVWVSLSSSNPSEGVVSPESLTFTPDNWNAPQLVTVTGIHDQVADGNQPYVIRIGAAVSSDPGYAGIAPPNVPLTNIDADSPSIRIAKSRQDLETSENGDSTTFTVVLGSKPIADVRIPLNSSNVAEGRVSPSLLTFTPTNYGAPQTVTITGVDDAVADGNQPYTILVGAAESDDAKYQGMDATDVSVTNRDNDSAGIVVSPTTTETSPLVTAERGDSATFTVHLQSQPTADVVLSMSSSKTQEGTISPSALTFTPVNWNAPQTVTLKGQDDLVADGSQPYSIAFAAAKSADANYDGMAVADVLARNVDNDTPGITVSPTSGLKTAEGSASGATFTIVLNSQPAGMASVKITLSSSATSEGTVSPSSVTFTASNWNAPQTVTVTGVNDAIADGAQPYTIFTGEASSTDANYNGINPPDVSVVNVDDDSAGLTVSAASGLSTSEAGGTANFTVRLNSQPLADVTIPIVSSNPAEGTVSPSSLTFTTSNWSAPQTVTVTGVNDSVADGGQPYTIVLGAATSSDGKYAGMDGSDVHVINVDDDSAGISISATADPFTTESGGTTEFTVRLNSQPLADVTIAIASSNTAEGTVSPSSLTFTATNWRAPQSVTVTGVNDAIADGNQRYLITLSSPSSTDPGYAAQPPAELWITNRDNDSPGITVSPKSGLETSETGEAASFSVSLQSQPVADVVISVKSSNPAEGTVAPSSLRFTAINWNAAQRVTVTGVNDAVADGNQSYTVLVGSADSTDPKYAGLNGDSVAVTNLDDDSPGVIVNAADGLATSEGGGTATFTVRLQSQPVADVTISVSSSNRDEGTVSTASLVFTPANWSAPQTVTVTGVDDSIVDGNQPYRILLGLATADAKYAVIEPKDVELSNTDNDTAGFDVVPSAGLVTTEAGGTATFTVCLRSQPGATVTIPLSSSALSEGRVSPDSLVFTNTNWNAPQTVTVTGVNDSVADGDQSYTILLGLATSADPKYAGLDPRDVAVTNDDDDVPKILVVAGSNLTTTEAGGKVAFGIRLNSQPTGDVTIPIESSNSGEGTVNPASVTFTATNWSAAQEVTVTGVDDAVQDGDQRYIILIRPTSSTDLNYNEVDLPDIPITNQDNDSAGVRVTSSPTLSTTEDGGTATISVQLDSRPAGTANVTIAVSSTDTSEGILDRNVISFGAADWDKPHQVTITGVDDSVADGDQLYRIVFGAPMSEDPNYANLSAPGPLEVINQDNDQPGILVTPTTCATYPDGEAVFQVLLTSQPVASVSLTLSVEPSAEATVSPTSIEFTSAPGDWSTPRQVTVRGRNDGTTGTSIDYLVVTSAAVSTDPSYAGKNAVDVACRNTTP